MRHYGMGPWARVAWQVSTANKLLELPNPDFRGAIDCYNDAADVTAKMGLLSVAMQYRNRALATTVLLVQEEKRGPVT